MPGAGAAISRTITRFCGSTVPAYTAACRVGPVRFPLSSRRYWCSSRSAEPISLDGSLGSVRTLMRVERARSPSMTSLPPRPLIVSPPAPPRRMLPSPHIGPSSGHSPAAELAATGARSPVSGGRIAARPWMRSTPAWSSASQPVKPPPPTSLGVSSSPRITSAKAEPESASTSCQRSRFTITGSGSPTRLLLIFMSSSAPTVSYWWYAQSKPPEPALRSIAAFCAIRSSPPSAS